MNFFRILLCVLALTTTCNAQTTSELKEHVTYLASDALRGRNTASKGYAQAAKYVYEQCQEYGLQVRYQKVDTASGKCKNVIAWIGDTDTVIVVGAHLDHIGTNRRGTVYNGADDNASGSAALLGLAKRFANDPIPHCTIVFQFYTGEEKGFLGSKYYVENPLLPKNNPNIESHVFMLNLDMIGRLKLQRKTAQRKMTQKLDFDVPTILQELYEKYPYAKGITFRPGVRSDQVSFAPHMPVVFLHTGLHSDYHRTTDDADKINYDGMVNVCEYAYDLLNLVIGDAPSYELWYFLPVYKGE